MIRNVTSKNLILPLFFILSGMWWGWTVLVDIFVIPTVFRTIGNFFQAGELGIVVFSRLNNLEVIVSSLLFSLIILKFIRNKNPLLLLILSGLLWSIAMIYFSYLTPKIVELTELWKKADEMGLTGLAGIPDIQQEHQFYHGLYIKLDVVKLILLTALLAAGIWKQEELR